MKKAQKNLKGIAVMAAGVLLALVINKLFSLTEKVPTVA